MYAWLIAVPALVAGTTAAVLLARRRGRAARRILAAANVAILLTALVLAALAVTGSPAQAGPGPQAAPKTGRRGAL